MARGRLPIRDYMRPDAPRRRVDYMEARGASEHGVAEQPDASNGGHARDEASDAGGAAHALSVARHGPNANGAATNGARPSLQRPVLLGRLHGAAVASPPIAMPLARAAVAAPRVARPAAGVPRHRASLREVFVSFEQRDFRYLGLSTLAVGFGQWAQQLGLPLLTLDLTGSATQLGALAFFRGIVGTVTAPIGGVLADRYPRRIVIVVSTALSMVQALALAALIVTNSIEMWHVYVFAFLGGIIQSLTQPARQAYVYDVSTDATLQNAIAMNSFVQNLSRIAAPPLVGAMVIWGIGAPFIFMAATQVIAVWFTLLISHNTRQAAPSSANPFRQIAEGFRFTWEDRRILGLVVVSTIPALLIFPYLPFIALVSRDVLHTGATGYGVLTSMLGWGSIIGMFFLAMFGDPPHKGRLMLIGFVGYAALLIVFSQSRSFVLDITVLGIAGIFFSVAQALNNTLIQVATRNEIRGRIMAVWQMSGGLQPLGALPLGFLITHYGVQVGIGSFMVSATVAFILFAALWSSVRRM